MKKISRFARTAALKGQARRRQMTASAEEKKRGKCSAAGDFSLCSKQAPSPNTPSLTRAKRHVERSETSKQLIINH
jgi:hypothetical protein